MMASRRARLTSALYISSFFSEIFETYQDLFQGCRFPGLYIFPAVSGVLKDIYKNSAHLCGAVLQFDACQLVPLRQYPQIMGQSELVFAFSIFHMCALPHNKP